MKTRFCLGHDKHHIRLHLPANAAHKDIEHTWLHKSHINIVFPIVIWVGSPRNSESSRKKSPAVLSLLRGELPMTPSRNPQSARNLYINVFSMSFDINFAYEKERGENIQGFGAH